MGDIEHEVEEELLLSDLDLKASVIKLGHHGSDTSSTERFLKAVDPRYAIICAGQDNKFGHPSGRVLKRLERQGVRYFQTGKVGTVVFESSEKGLMRLLDK